MRPPVRASRSKSLGLLALLVAVAAALPSAAAAAPTPLRAELRSCGEIPQLYTHEIRVRRVECPLARRVVVRYARETIENLQHDWSLNILGFSCDLTRKDFYGDSHRCTDGGRVIVWRRGSD